MNHAGDIARHLAEETLSHHGDKATIVPGGTTERATLIVWSSNATNPFRITVEAVEATDLTDIEIHA